MEEGSVWKVKGKEGGVEDFDLEDLDGLDLDLVLVLVLVFLGDGEVLEGASRRRFFEGLAILESWKRDNCGKEGGD